MHSNDIGTYARVRDPFDRDKMAMLPREKASAGAYLALNQLQDTSPEEAVMGCAVLFRVLVERCRLDPADMWAMSGRVLNAPEDGDRPTDNALQSLKDFAGARIMGQAVTYV